PRRLPERCGLDSLVRSVSQNSESRPLVMPDILQFGFMQRAFSAGEGMAIECPLIGVFLVPRRLSLIADTLAHVALAGVAIGLLVGASPILGALVVTVVGALGMARLRSHGALQGDAALAVFL